MAESANLLDFDDMEFVGFNTVYAPGLHLSPGTVIDPQLSLMGFTADARRFDHDNPQMLAANHLQMQLGMRFVV